MFLVLIWYYAIWNHSFIISNYKLYIYFTTLFRFNGSISFYVRLLFWLFTFCSYGLTEWYKIESLLMSTVPAKFKYTVIVDYVDYFVCNVLAKITASQVQLTFWQSKKSSQTDSAARTNENIHWRNERVIKAEFSMLFLAMSSSSSLSLHWSSIHYIGFILLGSCGPYAMPMIPSCKMQHHQCACTLLTHDNFMIRSCCSLYVYIKEDSADAWQSKANYWRKDALVSFCFYWVHSHEIILLTTWKDCLSVCLKVKVYCHRDIYTQTCIYNIIYYASSL